jgi:hypothetical protein
VVRAAEPATSTSSPPAAQQAGLKLDWPTDTETLRDLFTVSGPLAEVRQRPQSAVLAQYCMGEAAVVPARQPGRWQQQRTCPTKP